MHRCNTALTECIKKTAADSSRLFSAWEIYLDGKIVNENR